MELIEVVATLKNPERTSFFQDPDFGFDDVFEKMFSVDDFDAHIVNMGSFNHYIKDIFDPILPKILNNQNAVGSKKLALSFVDPKFKDNEHLLNIIYYLETQYDIHVSIWHNIPTNIADWTSSDKWCIVQNHIDFSNTLSSMLNTHFDTLFNRDLLEQLKYGQKNVLCIGQPYKIRPSIKNMYIVITDFTRIMDHIVPLYLLTGTFEPRFNDCDLYWSILYNYRDIQKMMPREYERFLENGECDIWRHEWNDFIDRFTCNDDKCNQTLDNIEYVFYNCKK